MAKTKDQITKRHTGNAEQRGRAIFRRSQKKYQDRYELKQCFNEGKGRRYGNKIFSLFDKELEQFIAGKIHLKRGDKSVIKTFKQIFDRRQSIGENPYLIEIYDFAVLGGKNGNPALFMELGLDNLEDKIDYLREEGGQFGLGEIVTVGKSICYGIESVHESKVDGESVANLDLKPGHIVFMEDGAIKLCDTLETARRLGITTIAKGTPEYLAPETKETKYHARPPADVYSLGLVLFEMAALQQFFGYDVDGSELNEAAREEKKTDGKWIKDQIQRASINKYLAATIEGCLQPKPAARYQTVAEVRRDLTILEREATLQAYAQALGIELTDNPTSVEQGQALIVAQEAFYNGLEEGGKSMILPSLEENFKKIIVHNAELGNEVYFQLKESNSQDLIPKGKQIFEVLQTFGKYVEGITINPETRELNLEKSNFKV